MGNFLKNLFLSVGIVLTGLILFLVAIILMYVSYVLAIAFAIVATIVVVFKLLQNEKKGLPE